MSSGASANDLCPNYIAIRDTESRCSCVKDPSQAPTAFLATCSADRDTKFTAANGDPVVAINVLRPRARLSTRTEVDSLAPHVVSAANRAQVRLRGGERHEPATESI